MLGLGRAGKVEGGLPPSVKSLAIADDSTEGRPSVKLLAANDIVEARPLVKSLGANYLGRVRPLIGSLA